MASDQTLRYHASSRHVYALALRALVIHARQSTDEFTVYPAKLDMLEHSGLAVSGPDLSGVSEVLDKIEGLARQEG